MNKLLSSLYMKYRLITSAYRALPGYVIIGAQKSGSTSLYDYLVQHPRLSAAKKKEVHYFSNNYDKGINWYKAHFGYKKNARLAGEATPYYLYHPLAAERIKATLPEAKIIAVLRDPSSRAISHYHHAVRHGFEKRTMKEAFQSDLDAYKDRTARVCRGERLVEHQENSYISRGFYVDQLDLYTELFSADNVLVLNSEDLFQDTLKTLKKVFQFLGVDTAFSPSDIAIKNPGNYKKEENKDKDEILDWLSEIYEPYNKALQEKYGVSFLG